MGRIEKEIEICGERDCKKIKSFFDTGSDTSWISSHLANKLGAKSTGFIRSVLLADGREMKGEEVELEHIIIEEYKRPKARVLVGNIPKEVIIGNQFMQEAGITIDFKKDKLKFGKPDLLLI